MPRKSAQTFTGNRILQCPLDIKNEIHGILFQTISLLQRATFRKHFDNFGHFSSQINSLAQNQKRNFQLYQKNGGPMQLIFHP